ncbi:MAG: oligosaccharide repeat unit polymerase, partial [Clostridiales bacterium]|nr:oligosaccharide repeat unit polymerase [Clostridiales bacterium]
MNTKKYTIIAIICWALLISSLIPMFRYAKYTNPSADDYTYSNSAKLEYDQSESIFLTIKAGLNKTIKSYSSWQGTYFGTFLMSISPNAFSISLYKIAPILLILIFILSVLLFIFVSIKFLFNSKIIYAFIISPIIIFLSFSFIPSLVEGIYWYNGAWYYTFSYCLSLILFSSIILFLKHINKKIRITNYIIAILLALMISGSNFTTSFFTFIILLSLTIIMFIYRSNNKLYILGITAISLIGLLLSYLAPGNSVRGDVINLKLSILDSIFYSIKGTFIFNSDWLIHNFIFVFLILLIPLFKN